MPKVKVGAVELYFELSGPEEAPVVVFSNSLGSTLEMWDAQAAALAARYRVLRYDTRGHGRSQVLDRPTTIDDLTDDLAGLLDALQIASAHVVGLSLGGMTGQCLAANYPEKVRTLTLMATSAHMPPAQMWADRAALARKEGLGPLVEATMGRWFTPAFATRDPALLAATRAQFLKIDPVGYAVCCGVIEHMDLRGLLGKIAAPTLIIVGSDDPSTPLAHGEVIRSGIAGAELVIVPRAAHLLAIEQPDIVNVYLGAFLDRHRGADAGVSAPDDLFQKGLANRKAVLGADHVARSRAQAGAFATPWQDFITRYAWGEIWGDPTLPRKTRSLITLAMMVALSREEEFKLHVRPALRNGVTLDELRSLLMQTSIYAGVPAANGAFRWVREVLGEEAG
jgi:3-oxoadipate enol-lactonase/4-carboxymuconolactone decarboxylase